VPITLLFSLPNLLATALFERWNWKSWLDKTKVLRKLIQMFTLEKTVQAKIFPTKVFYLM